VHRLILASRAFYVALFNAEAARQIEQALSGSRAEPPPSAPTQPSPATAPPPAPPRARKPAGRSDALTLLATLQREARFMDFIKEPIGDYSDAQIGAAVRDIHRDCAKVLDRLFDLRPILAAEEGSGVDVPAEPDRYRIIGSVIGSPPYKGTLVHHGWDAAKCDLPAWTGAEPAARVIASAEVEVK